MTAKRCPRCRQLKENDAFSKNKRNRDGLETYCRDCKKQDSREWRAKNKEHEKQYNKRYRDEHPEKVKESQKRWRVANKEYIRRQKAEHYEQNREDILAGRKRYYAEHKDERLAYSRQWQRNNPERMTFIAQRRRTRVAKAEGSHTPEEWIAVCERYGGICLCCGESKPLTADHIVPLSRGGTNYISNIQPLCLSCNCSKRDKTIDYRKEPLANFWKNEQQEEESA